VLRNTDDDEEDELFSTDGDILSLHKLLWHSQEKIGKYLSIERYLTKIKNQISNLIHNKKWSKRRFFILY